MAIEIFLLRFSMRDIDIRILSVRLSVCIVTISSLLGSPVILVLWISNIFAKFRRGRTPCWGAKYMQVEYKNFAIFDHALTLLSLCEYVSQTIGLRDSAVTMER